MPTLRESVGSVVDKLLSGVTVERVRASKLIRDALTATTIYEKHEISLLDLPIIQRLRRVHQTALAFLTYPCATHNRFQHTLGVMNIVDKLAKAFQQRYPKLMGLETLQELRIAAMLHDVGQGPFSHASEEIMEHMGDVKSALADPKFSKIQGKPHEMLSYLIITSDGFKRIIRDINRLHNVNIDVDRVADMIVGDMSNPNEQGYISDFINGPFDADKLDYMPRDAYFSGLKMDIDLDRIAYTCHVDERGFAYPRRLCADISGAHNLEQILFNKVLLYASIYHHHKTRAAVCMLRSIFEIVQDRKLVIDGLTFQDAADFLLVDDYDVLSSFRRHPELADAIENLKNRRMLKRALVISRKTVTDPMKLERLIGKMEDPDQLKKLRILITNEINKNGGKCGVYDIWVDFPDPPSLREPSQCYVRMAKDEYVLLKDVFPADWWLTAYGETKWKGHVFCPPQTQLRTLANEAAIKVLKNQFGVEVLPSATKLAKISDE